MKIAKLLLIVVAAGVAFGALAQPKNIEPDLSQVTDEDAWRHHNRNVTYQDGYVHMDAKPGDGIVWLRDFNFRNGTIEVDIKGKDEQGRSFVGIAFHGKDENTYDAIYFRPFNFRNPERSNHSVQYISHPEHTWNKLRELHTGKYEKTVTPVPDPSEWFHATIVVEYPVVKVFVNNSAEPSLTINQLSDRKEGWIGFWTGNNSEGDFRNLKVINR